MTSPLRILLVEDSIQDAELIQELLEADHFVCEVLTWFSPITNFLRSTAFPH